MWMRSQTFNTKAGAHPPPMIYAGVPRQLLEVLRLSDMYDGPGSAEIEIKVLRDMGKEIL